MIESPAFSVHEITYLSLDAPWTGKDGIVDLIEQDQANSTKQKHKKVLEMLLNTNLPGGRMHAILPI